MTTHLCDPRPGGGHDLGDRLVVMDNGYAAQIGSPLEVYERPSTMLFVAGFIGSPAMNFLEAHVSEDGRALVLPGTVRIPLNGAGLPAWARKIVILGAARAPGAERLPRRGHSADG